MASFGATQPGTLPQAPPQGLPQTVPTGEPMAAVGGPMAPSPTLGERVQGGYQKYVEPFLKSGILAQMFGSAMGPESSMGRMTMGAGQMAQARTMAEQYERLRRRVGPMMAGEEGPLGGFQGSPSAGRYMGGVEAMGLGPEMVKQFYGTALAEEEKARKAPLEAREAEAKTKLYGAYAEKSIAEALEEYRKTGRLDADAFMKVLSSLATLPTVRPKAEAEIKETEAKAEEHRAAAGLRKAEAVEKGEPAKKAAMERMIKVGKETQPFATVKPGEIRVPPFAAGAGPAAPPTAVTPATAMTNAKWIADAIFLPEATKDILAQYPDDVLAGRRKMEELRMRLADPNLPVERIGPLIAGYLKPEKQALFLDTWQMATAAIQRGEPISPIMMQIHKILNPPPTPVPAGEKAAIERFKVLPPDVKKRIEAHVKTNIKRGQAESVEAHQDRMFREMLKLGGTPEMFGYKKEKPPAPVTGLEEPEMMRGHKTAAEKRKEERKRRLSREPWLFPGHTPGETGF